MYIFIYVYRYKNIIIDRWIWSIRLLLILWIPNPILLIKNTFGNLEFLEIDQMWHLLLLFTNLLLLLLLLLWFLLWFLLLPPSMINIGDSRNDWLDRCLDRVVIHGIDIPILSQHFLLIIPYLPCLRQPDLLQHILPELPPISISSTMHSQLPDFLILPELVFSRVFRIVYPMCLGLFVVRD